ncbi:uncharacterized protein LOC143512594 isoform X3 [Brachyhypopomus gauderio]|uniref:uncharacterized protein LOC143512594 isoform X3 n=1 Tax=Brachyhypopomus gauderio TaxID=698409 RepID=UPI004043945A
MWHLTLTLCLMLHLSPYLISAEMLEMVEYSNGNAVTCGKGLIDCTMKPGGTCINHGDSVYVSALTARVLLCHVRNDHWRPCLRIELNITAEDLETSGVPGDGRAEPATATVHVCCDSPGVSRHRKLTFTLPSPQDRTAQTWISFLLELKAADLGSNVTILSSPALKHITTEIMVPPINTVCSQFRTIALCNLPSVSVAVNQTAGVVQLHLDSDVNSKYRELQACQKMEKDGRCFNLEWEKILVIPVSSVAPCLCFQIWWTLNRISNGLRKEFCPFINSTVIPVSNVSLSVVEALTNDEAGTSDIVALNWNITAPCRLEGELHLCKKTSEVDTTCHEMKDLRKTMLPQKWQTYNRHWQLQGEFTEVERHPSVCVQMKVKDMDVHFVPVCPFEGKEVTRAHWSWPLLVFVVLVSLTVLGAYTFQETLKGWVLRWLKVDDISRAVGGSQVVLLYPPDMDRGLAELVSGLASSLSNLGFSVSLDMWSRSELHALGPVPWLHSRLDRVQRHGGKVVLVLNQAAWARVEEWCSRIGHGPRAGRGRGQDAEADEGPGHPAPPCSDVFSASLSCILADYLQGRAGERFVLAQFEARPAGSPGGGSESLPELFRDLPLFSLPSQSLGFLTDLAHKTHTDQPAGDGVANRKMRAGMLRAASRSLTGALRELNTGAGYRLAGLSQDCVGFGSEDVWDSIPLQPGQSSSPASPDLPSKTNWV